MAVATNEIGIPKGRAVLTQDEAARICGVNVKTISNWIKEGRIRAVKANRRVMIPIPPFLKFLGITEDAKTEFSDLFPVR
jgi:excisionase family DNA binding protein